MVKNIGINSESSNKLSTYSFGRIFNMEVVIFKERFKIMAKDSAFLLFTINRRKHFFGVTTLIFFGKTSKIFISLFFIEVAILGDSIINQTFKHLFYFWLFFQILSNDINML